MVLQIAGLSFAHAGFVAIGAYTSAFLTMRVGFPLIIATPLSGIMAGLIALLIGFPTLRLKGMYFVMVTFAFAEFVRRIFMSLQEPFGGNAGIAGIPGPMAVASYYYFSLLLFVLTFLVSIRIDRSRIGKIYEGIKQDEAVAESLGINVMKYKVQAFVISSFFLGLAGSFSAHYFAFISPESFTIVLSINSIVYAVVGGIGSVFGPILGSFIMVGGTELIPVTPFYKMIFYGGILVVVLVLAPEGVIGLPARITKLFVLTDNKKT
jgi:branched-chain amino acid transport system permease protein